MYLNIQNLGKLFFCLLYYCKIAMVHDMQSIRSCSLFWMIYKGWALKQQCLFNERREPNFGLNTKGAPSKGMRNAYEIHIEWKEKNFHFSKITSLYCPQYRELYFVKGKSFWNFQAQVATLRGAPQSWIVNHLCVSAWGFSGTLGFLQNRNILMCSNTLIF